MKKFYEYKSLDSVKRGLFGIVSTIVKNPDAAVRTESTITRVVAEAVKGDTICGCAAFYNPATETVRITGYIPSKPIPQEKIVRIAMDSSYETDVILVQAYKGGVKIVTGTGYDIWYLISRALNDAYKLMCMEKLKEYMSVGTRIQPEFDYYRAGVNMMFYAKASNADKNVPVVDVERLAAAMIRLTAADEERKMTESQAKRAPEEAKSLMRRIKKATVQAFRERDSKTFGKIAKGIRDMETAWYNAMQDQDETKCLPAPTVEIPTTVKPEDTETKGMIEIDGVKHPITSRVLTEEEVRKMNLPAVYKGDENPEETTATQDGGSAEEQQQEDDQWM